MPRLEFMLRSAVCSSCALLSLQETTRPPRYPGYLALHFTFIPPILIYFRPEDEPEARPRSKSVRAWIFCPSQLGLSHPAKNPEAHPHPRDHHLLLIYTNSAFLRLIGFSSSRTSSMSQRDPPFSVLKVYFHTRVMLA